MNRGLIFLCESSESQKNGCEEKIRVHGFEEGGSGKRVVGRVDRELDVQEIKRGFENGRGKDERSKKFGDGGDKIGKLFAREREVVST